MPSGKSSKAVRNARSVVTATKPKPWGTIAAVLAILMFAGGIFGYLFFRYEDRRAFTPTADNQDPSTQIEGVVIQNYGPDQRGHIGGDKRVAYDHSPPFGGPHDAVWAACNGVVYETAVRNEHMVHALEHGAVWIAYNPDKITGPALQSLRDRVQGENYLMLSPYPGLSSPISLQSWGHQLKLTDPADKRIDQFIQSLRRNQYTYPEIGASCEVLPGLFDPAKPPPFVAEPPGPDAIPMNFSAGAQTEPTSPSGG
ncbi:MAG: DUF3105 domain-containing protein [Actinomycetota bacterium]|nr:DUF3105 domain-containing protein [Actinomycetota bacterium]